MVTETLPRSAWHGLADLRPDVKRILARTCRDSSELDDLVQETLLRAARFRDGLNDAGLLRPWLLRIAWNVMRDHTRTVWRRRQTEVNEGFFYELEGRDGFPGEAELPEELGFEDRVYERGDLLDLLRGALQVLEPTERHLLHTFYVEEHTCAETGRRLDLSVHTTKMRLFRIRRRLRRALVRRAALSRGPRMPRCAGVA